MPRFLRSLKYEGEDAMRKGVWMIAAAAFGVIGMTFVAGAVAAGAATVMPTFAALLLAGVFLVLIGIICALMSRDPEAARAAHNPMSGAIDQGALQLLSYNANRSPAKTLLAGLAAGATLGVLEALEHRRR